MSQRKKVFYRSNRGKAYTHSPYEHFNLEVFFQGEKDEYLTFTWQTDPETDYWYAGRVEIKGSTFSQVSRAYKLAQKITKPLNGYEFGLDDVLTRLEKIKGVEVEYDSRTMEMTPLAEMPAPELCRYMDDYRVFDNGCQYTGIKYAVLATDPEMARKEILKEAAQAGDTDFITRFIQADQPIFNSFDDRAPNLTPAREKAKLNGHS